MAAICLINPNLIDHQILDKSKLFSTKLGLLSSAIKLRMIVRKVGDQFTENSINQTGHVLKIEFGIAPKNSLIIEGESSF